MSNEGTGWMRQWHWSDDEGDEEKVESRELKTSGMLPEDYARECWRQQRTHVEVLKSVFGGPQGVKEGWETKSILQKGCATLFLLESCLFVKTCELVCFRVSRRHVSTKLATVLYQSQYVGLRSLFVTAEGNWERARNGMWSLKWLRQRSGICTF